MQAKGTGEGVKRLAVLAGGRAARPGRRRAGKGSSSSAWTELVEAARREWLACRAYFNSVSDPELVDHAIFSVQAAERKYMYLLRRARDARLAPLQQGEPADGGGCEARQGPSAEEGTPEAAGEI